MPPEVRLTRLDWTGSTNEDALAAARAGDPGPHWFVAGRQRAGRGRGGRAWVSEPGNLHATLLVTGVNPRIAPQLGFVAGLALHDAALAVSGLAPERLRIKWPNDLLLDGLKLAGLLLEAETGGRGRAAVAIGFGVNVRVAPGGLPYGAACLADAVPDPSTDALLVALAHAMAARLDAWRRAPDPDAFGAVRRLWLERAAGLGETITVRRPGGEATGRFAGLDATGRLVLDTEGGRHLIDAGDVVVGRAAAAHEISEATTQGW